MLHPAAIPDQLPCNPPASFNLRYPLLVPRASFLPPGLTQIKAEISRLARFRL
jgi:hypothetical protein